MRSGDKIVTGLEEGVYGWGEYTVCSVDVVVVGRGGGGLTSFDHGGNLIFSHCWSRARWYNMPWQTQRSAS